MTKLYLKRILPAANATALVAALIHVVSIAIISRQIALPDLAIGVMTYIVVMVIAIPAGSIMLAFVGWLRLGRIGSLIAFLFAAQILAYAVISYLFEVSLSQVPPQYLLISVPASLTAWYQSVYHVLKRHAGMRPENPDNRL